LIAEAVARALERGIIVVAAAGNSGGALAYPAALPGMIAVTALAGPITPYQPAYASRGAGLWLTAYGGDLSSDQDQNGIADGILSTDLGEAYGLRSGTSMAAPQVTGVSALALSTSFELRLIRNFGSGCLYVM
jgi:serine protease